MSNQELTSYDKSDMINEAIMRLFKAYIVNDENKLVQTGAISVDALTKGLFINELCPVDIIELACDIWGIDGFLLNQTFHKSLQTVADASMESLFAQQLIHYFTTYGLERVGLYDADLVYIPKEKLEVPELSEDVALMRIQEISIDELKKKLWLLCESNIALSKQTISDVITLCDFLDLSASNIDSIKNKELSTALCDFLGILPSSPEAFVRFLVYKLTDKTLLIKDKSTKTFLERCSKAKAFKLLSEYDEQYGLVKLSEVFNRFKPIFLALKTNLEEKRKKLSPYGPWLSVNNDDILLSSHEKQVNSLINKISKLSKKHHKPMITNDLDMFVKWCFENENDEDFPKLLENKIEDSSIWRAIRLRNYLSYKKLHTYHRVYKIRNGKTWIETEYADTTRDPDFALEALDAIIVDKLKMNVENKTVYLEDGITLVLPQSEKQYVGNIPFGSSITLEKANLIFGIHWYNINDERIDLDLSLISSEYVISWHSQHKENDMLLFSGDMTDAPYPNGASEYVYVDKAIGNTIFSLKVNNFTMHYYQDDDIEFDIIIAKGYRSNLGSNHVVDPNDVIIRIPNNIIEKGSAEHLVGTVIINETDMKFVFTDLTARNKRVSEENDLEKTLRRYIGEESKSKGQLRSFLEQAGAILTDDPIYMEHPVDIDLSLNKLSKDTLIKLLS